MTTTDTGAHTPMLARAISGDEAAAAAIYARTFPKLRRRARALAQYLPDDLHDEIVQETWALVQSRGISAFEGAKVDDETYLHMVMRNAVENVAADYRPPGTRSRATKRDVEHAEYHRQGAIAVEEWHAASDFQSALEARMDVASLVDRLTSPERRALALVLEDGVSLSEAARQTGLKRQTFARRLQVLRAA